MTKKVLVCVFSALFVTCGFIAQSFGADAGPAEMQLISSTSTKQPPAQFPHKKHQDVLKCGDCHHTMTDGKQAPYTEGMEIKKCESCHNAELLAGKTKGKDKLDTFQGAGHGSCVVCHKETATKDPSKKELKSCKTCHKK